MRKVWAAILAGGIGSRFGNNNPPKQLMMINGKTVLEHSLEVFDSVPKIDEIVLVVHDQIRMLVEPLLTKRPFDKPIRIVLGGRTRLESSRAAVQLISDRDLILIHDAVRPFVSVRLIDRCLTALEICDAVYPVVPSPNTIVESTDGRTVTSVPVRNHVRIGQTPQGFRGWVVKRAHEIAGQERPEKLDAITNDGVLVQFYGISPICLVDGERQNVKITYPEDGVLAPHYLRLRDSTEPRIRDSIMDVDGWDEVEGERRIKC